MINNGNVLITGGAGFIGSQLSLKLLNMGFKITVVDNLVTGLSPNTKFYFNFRLH